uniref:Peptidase C48, SUMO/sentrin/Ubl1 n=1 Tax=Tanacetum cinerariifolium TaxID=118510 RepID=A0A699H8C2_TANCI|nr:peptidase C48, SUMO/sentrin/Ubl1 [Tanacetum cinerariifolium]
MGFGDLIDFPIVEIPTKLAFYVVDILNTRKMTLECPMGGIVITPKAVKEVIRLPMGRRKLEREGKREYNYPFLLEWKDRLKNVNKLTIKALSNLIIDTQNTDYKFRMNILTLIANTLESCDNSSTLKFTVLKNVFERDDERMHKIFKEPYIPEYNSSSSSEPDDDSQLGDENEKSYGSQIDSGEEDHVQIVREAQQEEINNLHYTDEEHNKKYVFHSEDKLMKDENVECSEKR